MCFDIEGGCDEDASGPGTQQIEQGIQSLYIWLHCCRFCTIMWAAEVILLHIPKPACEIKSVPTILKLLSFQANYQLRISNTRA